jgi:hypothetical protein
MQHLKSLEFLYRSIVHRRQQLAVDDCTVDAITFEPFGAAEDLGLHEPRLWLKHDDSATPAENPVDGHFIDWIDKSKMQRRDSPSQLQICSQLP